MGFFERLGSKISSGFKRIGQKESRAFNRIGRKISHEATRVLGNVARATGKAEMMPFLPPQVASFVGAVGAGARLGMEGIEAGKDVGRFVTDKDKSQLEKAVRRVPRIAKESRNVARGIEGAVIM